MLLRWTTTITCFATAALIGASAQGRDVSGQVSIVAGAHESVKLGLVPISVYARDAMHLQMGRWERQARCRLRCGALARYVVEDTNQ